MEQKIYQIAIIGFGGMGSYHTKLIQPVAQLQVCGVYDILPYRMELAGTQGLRAYSSLEEVLEDSAVDVVLIATPNDSHKDIAIRALQA
ncbi:MAG: dehydrogenase [Paenibacillaceae bacterium]|nr:dehydrogenase [Paenibacillaceae bacterium]